MRYKTEILAIFFLGLIAGVYFRLSNLNLSPKPISSRLPELIFPKSDSPFSLIFTGDVMLGRSVNTQIQKYQDFTWPFKNIASTLADADLTIINLEAPLVDSCRPTDTGMVFCADPKSVAGLVLSGVDIASIANNHTANYGQQGLETTISILKENQISPVGFGLEEFRVVQNTRLAFLSFSDFPEADENEIKKQISQASQSSDLVIVIFHFGAEYRDTPDSRQVFLAHHAIDSGADLVVGHHPHWTQTEEIYLGKPIFYSLGNLIFDQMWSEKTRLGQILRVTYKNNSLIKKEIIPVKIFDFGQPNFIASSADDI